jgi:hypothetical protein
MVKIIKLTTGEEIIGKVTESLDGSYNIKDPVTIGMVERNQIGFIGYMPYADLKEGLNVGKERIMFVVPIDSKLEAEYNAMFSNLIVPPKKGLTLTT